MEMPAALKATIETEYTACSQRELTAAAQAISERYRKETGQGKRLLTRDVEALAYAVVRMPATYGAVSRAMRAALDHFDGSFTDLMDVGAGTGAATWAIADLLGDPLRITCLEREDAMIRMGSRLMATDERLAGAQWVRHDLAAAPVLQEADLVVASYALGELDAATRRRVLENLWQCTRKLLVIIEPGTPVGSAQLREARTLLCSLGGHVAAPCPHSAACPLPQDDWCHFTCRVSRSRLHKQLKGGDAPYEDEKFSFLAVSKTPVQPASARILRHPMKEAGRITLRLCTQNGIADRAVTKKEGDTFKRARKADAGDEF